MVNCQLIWISVTCKILHLDRMHDGGSTLQMSMKMSNQMLDSLKSIAYGPLTILWYS